MRSQASAPIQWLMTKPVEHLNKALSINYDASTVIWDCVADLHPWNEVARLQEDFVVHRKDARLRRLIIIASSSLCVFADSQLASSALGHSDVDFASSAPKNEKAAVDRGFSMA